jgi:hypothetical protein
MGVLNKIRRAVLPTANNIQYLLFNDNLIPVAGALC